jgi:hypothetical protein
MRAQAFMANAEQFKLLRGHERIFDQQGIGNRSKPLVYSLAHQPFSNK